jgi:truncated hemoglobin YjbI
VDRLYDRIETDAVLRPAFNPDLTGERERQKLFFEAWFGGAPTYFDAAWRPGLKVKHEAISISPGMACRWVGHFLDSLAEVVNDPILVNRINPFISRLAMALVNRADEPVPGERLRRRCSNADLQPLLYCVQRDDVEGLATAAAGHPHGIPRHGAALLLIAAVRGKARAAEELLRQGVDANAPAMLPGNEASVHGLPVLQISPLCAALARGRESVVKLLVAQYDIFTASCVGDLDAVRELLDLAPNSRTLAIPRAMSPRSPR